MNRIILVYILLIVYLAVGLSACRSRFEEALRAVAPAPSALTYELDGDGSRPSAALTPSLAIDGDL